MNLNFDNIFPLGIGIMRYNFLSQEEINSLIYTAYSNGVRYFEACDFYLQGKCENYLAEALSNIPREEYFLCDKMPLTGFFQRYDSIEEFFNQQLKKCNTTYFDVYLIQAVDRNNYELLQSKGILDFFNKKREEGIIHKLGFSFHDEIDIFEKVLNINTWDVVQLQLNYYDWYLGCAKQLYLEAKNRSIPIIVMGPCKGGTLTNNLPIISQNRLKQNNIDSAELCYKFLTTLSGVKMILTGAESQKMLKQNLNFFNKKNFGLTQLEKENIIQNIDEYKQYNYIQCTNCGYCLSQCPKQIPINDIFQHYNTYLQTGEIRHRDWLYNAINSKNSIQRCIRCKSCENMCPQHLPILQLFRNNIFPLRR